MVMPLKLASVWPLVRYVDEDQAVIDAHVATTATLPGSDEARGGLVDIEVELAGGDGFHDEGHARVRLEAGAASMRFEIVHPDRWWPAGMGPQPLYELTVRLVIRGELIDERRVTLGLTSVRRPDEAQDDATAPLLVNGREWRVHSLIHVDRVDESQLLPATGDSVLVVRDHYGPDVLYQAADRAGILLIQCVPIHPEARPMGDAAREVARLVAHPSLAGWFVGHLGDLADTAAQHLRGLDPTRTVFRALPRLGQAS